MKAMLTTFGAHLPRARQLTPEGGLLLPPVVAAFDRMDLDYSALLLFDGVLIDRLCLDYVIEAQSPDFKYLAESMKWLVGEGYAEVRDYGAVAKAYAQQVSDVGHELSADFRHWMPALRHDLRTWWADVDDLSQVAPRTILPSQKYGFAIGSFLMDTCGRIDPAEAKRLQKLILSKRKRYTRIEQQTLSTLVRPCIEMLQLNLLLSREFAVETVFDWPQTRRFYETRAEYHLVTTIADARTTSTREKELAKFRELFSVAFPSFRPTSAQQFVRLFKDRRLQSLRERVAQLAEADTVLDAAFARYVYEELTLAQQRYSKWRRYVGYAMAPLSLLPIPLFGSDKLLEGAINRKLETRFVGDHRWLYFTFERVAASSSLSSE